MPEKSIPIAPGYVASGTRTIGFRTFRPDKEGTRQREGNLGQMGGFNAGSLPALDGLSRCCQTDNQSFEDQPGGQGTSPFQVEIRLQQPVVQLAPALAP